MINNLKNNTKIKIISLLSAIVLWIYVMAIVDPQETKRFEDIPITIDNMKELAENNLVIYPQEDLTTDIYLTGNVSNLKNITKEKIHVYGQFEDVLEGNGRLYLKAIIDERVTYEFKTKVKFLNLEKVVNEDKNIQVIVEGKSKDNIDNIQKNIETVKVSGPRTLVKDVKNVVATLNVDKEQNDFSAKLNLIPVNEKGKKVDGVELSTSNVVVSATVLNQKEVPIKMVYNNQEGEEVNLDNYKLSQDKVLIKGKKEVLDKINSINTQMLNLSDIDTSGSVQVNLEVPEGILISTKTVTLKSEKVKKITDEFNYGIGDIEIRNNENNIEVSKIKIPESIKVSLEYTNDSQKITNSDIVLYIDLATINDNKVNINYETTRKLDSVKINPSVVEIEQ